MDDKDHYLEDLFCDKKMELSLLRNITNNFSQDSEIGRGGFGIVYKGALRDGFLAVKKFISVIDVKAFLEEVNCLRRIKHKNIVRYIGYCAELQKHFLVVGEGSAFAESQQLLICFEYLRNGSLGRYLKNDQPCELKWPECYKIIHGICLGLHHLHERDMIHRDIKPDNILLDDDMTPKIADFGLSRLLVDGESEKFTINPQGTRGYMAPEFIHHNKYSVKSDIFALGRIIEKMVTGHQTTSMVETAEREWGPRLDHLDASEKRMALEQVKACIEISARCTQHEAASRPVTQDILARLITPGGSRWSAAGGINTSIVPVQMLSLSSGRLLFSQTQTPAVVEATTGATSYKMLSARSLQIANNKPGHWSWNSVTLPYSSRSEEYAELISVYFLAVTGEVQPKDLSAGRSYTVYLVYRLTSSNFGLEQEGSVQTSSLRLYGNRVYPMGEVSLHPEARRLADHVTYPVSRGDGWLELRLADFANDGNMLNEQGVIVDLREENLSLEKSGIIVKGMEFRGN